MTTANMKTLVRVAAAQFAVTTDIQANLQTCLRVIDEAAMHKPQLVVLPEFCNHLAWWRDAAHCMETAVNLDGDFLSAIAERAKRHGMLVKVNVTLRRNGFVTGTNVLVSPEGERIGVGDKQVLMGNENNFLTRATECTPIVETGIGKIGMYCCMDGVVNEVTRSLALRGAQILANSLNSFAHDEAALHVPVRAAENKVFVVAACKVGALVPPDMLDAVATRMQIAPTFLHGAGESQIVSPSGSVLAIAPRAGEAVVWADIDPNEANDKRRPDGTDIFATRRPKLYRPIAQSPKPREAKLGVDEADVAVLIPRVGENLQETICNAATNCRLIVLPELFNLSTFQPSNAPHMLIDSIKAALTNSECLVATSIVENEAHVGVLISSQGIVHRQKQLHRSERNAWIRNFGDSLDVYDADWARLAIILGDDSIYPETFRLAALQNVEVVAVLAWLQEKWEIEIGLPERAAENRIAIVCANTPRQAMNVFGGVFASGHDFTLWTEWESRPFDGNINTPIVSLARDFGLTRGKIYPSASANRIVSQKTNVVDGRPWWLVDEIVETNKF